MLPSSGGDMNFREAIHAKDRTLTGVYMLDASHGNDRSLDDDQARLESDFNLCDLPAPTPVAYFDRGADPENEKRDDGEERKQPQAERCLRSRTSRRRRQP